MRSPATGGHVGSAPDGDAQDVDAAMRAARASFESGVWSRTSPADRAAVLRRAADLIEECISSIAALVSGERCQRG